MWKLINYGTRVLVWNTGAAGAIASVVHDGFMNPIEGKWKRAYQYVGNVSLFLHISVYACVVHI